jgi:di/tripeptidase
MYTLELAQLIATPQERLALANGTSHDNAIVMSVVETVEAKMWAKMFEFEKSSVAISTSQRSRKTKSYNDFGSRVKAYKKEVKAKLHSNASWQDQPLLEPQ